jgi:ferredoxin
MKKIILDENSCIGCGACISLDAEHFDFSDDGLSTIISNNNLESEELKNAIESCPTNAITLENDECSCENCNCENCDCNENECHCNN